MATGITVQVGNQDYLVTSRHVVTGYSDATPDEIAVDHHDATLVGRWVRVTYPLRDTNGRPMWIEHPSGQGARGWVDVAALPFKRTPGIHVVPFPLELADSAAYPTVAAPVSVIGFPRGVGTGGNWPIWITGHIASDPDLDYDYRPVFLIDARTREGMSGSPVVIRTNQIIERQESTIIYSTGPTTTKFLVVYAGRLGNDFDIGYVWRPYVLREVLEGRVDPTVQPGRFNAHLSDDDSPIRDAE
jgi:hypothetical protein